MTQRVTGQRFRQRKLSTKQNLPILRENEVEPLPDDEASRHIPKVETGVEKGEEIEHHLQAVIASQAVRTAAGKSENVYIPTPEAVDSQLQYPNLYPRKFTQPATYIRFSSTVEDSIGCLYCMNSDDAAFLKVYNQKRGKNIHCSEDEFEQVMNFFEEMSQTKQPYATVDNTPVLPYEDFESEFDETISELARRFAKDIYVHWKNQRLLKGNRMLMPTLKFETNLDTDDSDPYVCFRRREVRQVRKTRGRDAQVTEKIRKLRKELEEARFLMAQVKKREMAQRDQLAIDKQIFEQRAQVKELKRKLSIKADDEELLITQKPPPKPNKIKIDVPNRGVPGLVRPQVSRPDGRILDSDLIYLEDQKAKKDQMIDGFIEENLMKHQKWNVGWVDQTWRPITPPLETAVAKSEFRAVHISSESQLLTPPPSLPEENTGEQGDPMEVDQSEKQIEPRRSARIRYATPPEDIPFQEQDRFRRRLGRGGRIMMDRRGVKRPLDGVEEVECRVADRYKFSGEESEDDQIYPIDWTDNLHIRYRIMIERQGEKQHAQQAAAANRRAIENHNRSASGHLLPPSGSG
ncbi:hypothetical protein P154DRAFT_519302 [Amniculicola lignicola CBS 123094]|uniref:Enhancer of polycomb-like protein n=1 Tax=Amniculicola lignicola CBS 123094 TaxID=1392246 RepID=A0A6A5WUN0_9PLEO|nr:hypothetical protein P154DRAFT_519302 [Amniculicola lignicola CBS 123094]